MRNKIIAQRYSDAFVSFAKGSMGLERIVDELKNLKFIFSENPDLLDFLANLEILRDEKSAAIDIIFKDFSEEVRDFLKLLIDKGRVKNIIGICDYVRVQYSKAEAVDALLKTSYPLDLDLIKRIKERMEDKFNRKLNLHIELDAELLGGVQIRVGNRVLDGSVKKRLEELREKLMLVKV